MVLSQKLDRSLRARAHRPEEEASDYSSTASEHGVNDELTSGSGSDSALESGSESGSEDDDASDDNAQYQEELSKVSFGALAKAQAALGEDNDPSSRKRKRGSDTTNDNESKLQALRARLKQIKEAKEARGDRTKPKSKGKNQDEEDSESSSGSDSGSESDSDDNGGRRSRKRSSKHAPQEVSSKRPVKRGGMLPNVPAKPKARDPRFDPAIGSAPRPDSFARKYEFLSQYRQSEISQLRAALKQSKNESERVTLKRKINSMENQDRAAQAKEREQKVKREQRKKEKEAIAQGKKPFYMKEGELKKLALKDKFEGMKGKDMQRAIERRRTKVEQKEKKKMPNARRATG